MAHHQAFSNYQSRDVLVFESVSADNIHLCVGKPGLFTSDQELILGKFEEEEEDFEDQVVTEASGGCGSRKRVGKVGKSFP